MSRMETYMREDYDISELNPRKNPYSEKLDCSEKDELLEKEFNFDKAVKNPYYKELNDQNRK